MAKIKLKEISLALGSGSAKGVAHIGVIETLERAKIKINAVAGTSMGGVVAAYYAFGKLDLLKDWLLSLDKVSTFKTIDFTFKGGFISGDRFMSIVESHLGRSTFEDAKIPLYIPATNLDLGIREVFTKGFVVPAIRASISVPGVLKPYHHNETYYVDGAVTDPVPVDILIDKGHKDIVAVHLNEYIYAREDEASPNFLDTMSRSMSIVSKYLANAQMKGARVILSPKLEDVGMFELYRSEHIMAEGAKVAEEAIASGKLDCSVCEYVSKMIKK